MHSDGPGRGSRFRVSLPLAEKQKDTFDEFRKKYKDEIEKMDEGDQKELENIYRKGRECLKKFDVNAG